MPKTERWQQTLSNKITLLFGKYTQITANGFPEHYFEFAAYNGLDKIADDKDSGLTAMPPIFRVLNTQTYDP